MFDKCGNMIVALIGCIHTWNW